MAVNLIDSNDIKVTQDGSDISLDFDTLNLNNIIDGRISPLSTYSTSETRIGTWTDGKPIYRQVITGTTASSNSPTAIGSITNLGEIVKIDGFIRTSNQSIPANFVYNTEQNSCYREGNNIIVRTTASSYQNKSCYIIVEYTKTTD